MSAARCQTDWSAWCKLRTGMCDQGPALLVNGQAIPALNEQRIDAIAELIRSKGYPLPSGPPGFFRIEDNVRRADVLLDCAMAPGDASSAAHAGRGRRPDGFQHALLARRSADRAGRSDCHARRNPAGPIRGPGGEAGFTTGLKWEACRNAPLKAGAAAHCGLQCRRGEPGTFQDRVLLAAGRSGV